MSASQRNEGDGQQLPRRDAAIRALLHHHELLTSLDTERLDDLERMDLFAQPAEYRCLVA